MSPRHFLLLLAVAVIWGTNFVIAKIGMVELPPFLFSGLRFLFLALPLLPFLKIHKGQMRDVLYVCVFAGGLHFAFFFAGLAVSSASVSALVVQLNAPFATIMSIIFLKEHVGWRRWTGIGLAFGGVVFIGFDPSVFNYRTGMVLLSMSALMYGFATIVMRRLQGIGVLQIQSWTSLISVPILLTFTLVFESGQLAAMSEATWRGWGSVVYTAIFASLIGHGGVYYLYQRYEVSLVSPMLLLAPMVGVISGLVFFGEPFTVRIAVGGLAVLAGVAVIGLRQKRRQDQTAKANSRLTPVTVVASDAETAPTGEKKL